jgi:hypothetical protein
LALLEAHREGAKVEDAKGVLPLHYAIENENTPTEVTLAILEANEDAARFSNRNGEFPLHIAAKCASPVEITIAILAANPDAARAHHRSRYLPLHIAVKQRSTENLLALLRAYPEGVKDTVKITNVAHSHRMYSGSFTPENVTPLLLAARKPSQATPEMFAALFWAYPEALLQKDEKGNVPNGFCVDEGDGHGLRRMTHNILWDYGALVEFHLCMFSARRTAGHPLYKFGSDSFAPHHRQIASFLLPCHGESKVFSPHLAMRRRIVELCMFPLLPQGRHNSVARLYSVPRSGDMPPEVKEWLAQAKRREREQEKARARRSRREEEEERE